MDERAWSSQPGFFELPRFLQPRDELLKELLHRCDVRELRPWEWQVFWDRLFKACPDQRVQVLVARERWPAELSVSARVGFPYTIQPDADWALRVRIRGAGRPWIDRSLSTTLNHQERDFDLGLPPSAPAFDVEAEIVDRAVAQAAGMSIDTSRSRMLWKGVLRHVRVVSSAAQAIAPLSCPEMDDAIDRELGPGLGRDRGGGIAFQVDHLGFHIGGREGTDWALGTRVEVLHDGRVVAVGEMLYPMELPGVIADFMGPHRLHFDLAWSEAAPQGTILQGDWRVRVTGDPSIAIRDLGRVTCWAGQITVPLGTIGTVEYGWWE
jgi:hypothetical protein